MASAIADRMSRINIERLIDDIHNRPAIWNRNFQCTRSLLDVSWGELSNIHGVSTGIIKQKWKQLRDAFRVEMKRIPRDAYGQFVVPIENYESRCRWFHPMTFLIGHMRDRFGKDPYEPQYNFHGFSDETMFASDPVCELLDGQYALETQNDTNGEGEDYLEDENVDLKASVLELIDNGQSLLRQSAIVRVESELPPLHYSEISAPANPTPIVIVPGQHTSQTTEIQTLLSNVGHNVREIQCSRYQPDNAHDKLSEMEVPRTTQTTISPRDQIHVSARSNKQPEYQADSNSQADAYPQAPSQSSERPSTPQRPESSRSTSSSNCFNLPTVTVNLTKLNIPASTVSLVSRPLTKSPKPLRRSVRTKSIAVTGKSPHLESLLKSTSPATISSTENSLLVEKTTSSDATVSSSKRKRSLDQRQSDAKSATDSSEANATSSTVTPDAPKPDFSHDDDYNFLISLHPYMRELSVSQKLKVRMKVQKLIFKELYSPQPQEDKQKK